MTKNNPLSHAPPTPRRRPASGRLAVNVGNCLAVLAQALTKAIELSELDRRVAALETRTPRRRVA